MKPTLLLTLACIASQAFAATPAELAIQQAIGKVSQQPDHYPYYNALATAYARRARETSDTQFYAKAEETLKKSFALESDNFEGLKVEAWLCLGRHEFAKALEIATRLSKIAPDDVAVYGYMVDADVELGNYNDAVAAAQWMLDLRPGNVPALARAAYLRELHGNSGGALELLQMALDSTPLAEREDRAWLLTQMAHLELENGDLSKAETFAGGALGAFPDYHYALGAMAQVRVAQTRYQEATALLAQRYRAAPRTEVLYQLAEAQELAGEHERAEGSFREFEQQALAQSALPDNANRQLISYYLDHASEPVKALQIARRELERRHDVLTLASYAWALAGNGDYDAADAEMQKALGIGVKDPELLYHAGAIALHLHQAAKAELYLKDAAARYSGEASILLRSLREHAKAGGN